MPYVWKNEVTPARRRVAIFVYTSDGVTPAPFATAFAVFEVRIRDGDFTYSNSAGTFTSTGIDGEFIYEFTQAETNLAVNEIGIKVDKAGYAVNIVVVEVLDPADFAGGGGGGGGLTAAQTADAVWGAVRASYATVGTFGEGVASVKGAVASVGALGIDAGVLTATALAAIGTAVWGTVLEAPHTAGDLMRGAISIFVGKLTTFGTGTLINKSLNGAKTRWTIITNLLGRQSVTPGDLT